MEKKENNDRMNMEQYTASSSTPNDVVSQNDESQPHVVNDDDNDVDESEVEF